MRHTHKKSKESPAHGCTAMKAMKAVETTREFLHCVHWICENPKLQPTMRKYPSKYGVSMPRWYPTNLKVGNPF